MSVSVILAFGLLNCAVSGDITCTVIGLPLDDSNGDICKDIYYKYITHSRFINAGEGEACKQMIDVLINDGTVVLPGSLMPGASVNGKFWDPHCKCVMTSDYKGYVAPNQPLSGWISYEEGSACPDPNQCAPVAGDSECVLCGKSNCCDASLKCNNDDLCFKWATCINNGGSAATCTAALGSNALTDAIYTCATKTCANECGWVSSARADSTSPSVPAGEQPEQKQVPAGE
jgi:hypothetical protein